MHALRVGFDPAFPCITIRVSGSARAEGFAESMREVLAHPEWRPDLATLSDFSELELTSFRTEELRKVVDLLLNLDMDLVGSGRSAVLVPGGPGYGLVRMWTSWWEVQGASATRQVRVFLTMEGARRWLTKPEDA